MRRLGESELELVQNFHDLYYRSGGWANATRWFGQRVMKCPLDCWQFQEIIQSTKPSVVIETGTGSGGSSLFFANMLDLLGAGKVITIDSKTETNGPKHPRINYLRGSSISDEIVTQVRNLIQAEDRVMVDLDSAHTKGHVLRELEIYSEFVSPGCYLIVEDTNCSGPKVAVEEFLQTHTSFVRDTYTQRFLLSFNPGGYLINVGHEIGPWHGHDPEESWGFLDVRGKFILDIGADYGSTARYFLNKGARTVIGVEYYKPHVDILREVAKLHHLITGLDRQISCAEDYKKLFQSYPIDLAKIDGEGCEAYLLDLDDESFAQIPEYAIELHGLANSEKAGNFHNWGNELQPSFEERFQRCGYEVEARWLEGKQVLWARKPA